MKSRLSMLSMALILSFSLVACGESTSDEAPAVDASSPSIETTAPEEIDAADMSAKVSEETSDSSESASAPSSADTPVETQVVTVGGLSITVPANWTVTDDENGKYIFTNFKALLYLVEGGTYSSRNDDILDEAYESFVEGYTKNSDATIADEPEKFTIGDAIAYRAPMDVVIDGDSYNGWIELVFGKTRYDMILLVMPESTSRADSEQCLGALNSVVVNDTQAASTEAAPKEPKESAPEPKSVSNETVSQANAVSKAKSYLRYTAFSYSGLVDQLEFEGFSTEDATYGVEHCGADWNEQALLKADSYLKYTAFSYSGLIDQLEFEGFTTEQATYGADNCGADWFVQAERKAESYMKYTSFSRDGLIDQLEFEGFTYEQAAHGADSVGL